MKARTLVTAILLVVFLIQSFSEIVEANPNPLKYYMNNQPMSGISSPVNRNSFYSSFSNPIVYKKPSFNITFFIELPNNFSQIDSFSYTINGSSANLSFDKKDNGFYSYTKYSVSKTIDNLQEGIYNLKVNILYVNGTTNQFMDAYVKIDLSPPLDPLLPLYVALIVIVILSLTTALFFSVKSFKKLQKDGSSNSACGA